MARTMESRAIYLGDHVPDLYVATTYLPERTREGDVDRIISSGTGVARWTSVRRSGLKSFWNSLPEHIQSDFPDTNRSWLDEDRSFVERILQIQLEGDVLGPVGGAVDVPHFSTSDPFSSTVEFLHRNRRRSQGSALEGIGHRQAVLYVWALARLHGVYSGGAQTRAAAEALEDAYSLEIPISHSPGLEGVTLKDLASKGIKSACFFPLLGGVYGGVQSLLAAQLLLALQLTGVGAGMTLVAVSTLWVADKLFGSIKHIGD